MDSNRRPLKCKRCEFRGKEQRTTHHSFMEKFDQYIHANMHLDIETKRAALKSSESVVSLVSRKDEKAIFACSGTIIGCEAINGAYRSTILTAASLLRSPSDPNAKRDDIEVHVYLFNGKSFVGRVSAFDFHFNLAIMDMTTDEAIPTANLRPLDDSVSVDPGKIVSLRHSEVASQSFQLDRHSVLFKIRPGDMVIAIGRSAGKDHELMAAPGKFCLDRCKFDCRELFMATCIITKCGIGGPLVNFHGEVIGVNFYEDRGTPFLPINIVSKCLKQFGKNQDIHGPWLGMEMKNLSAASVSKLEKFYSSFKITEGVVVKEVIKGSCAEQAGIHIGDLIVQCEKEFVRSFLEFNDILWKNVGETVEVVVIRESRAVLNLKLFVAETSPDKVNRWPIPLTSKAF